MKEFKPVPHDKYLEKFRKEHENTYDQAIERRRAYMRELASFKPSKETIEKMMQTRKDRGQDQEYFRQLGKKGGRPRKDSK